LSASARKETALKTMFTDIHKLNLVRVGNTITYSSLKTIGKGILSSFKGMIDQIELAHHDGPQVDQIDAQLLTMILHEQYGGHTLGITDADLRTEDQDEFYSTIIGGKNTTNYVAVVSTKKLSPEKLSSEREYQVYILRTLKVSLHEIGHNLGLTDHASYKRAPDGSLCPMSKGEFNKFGYRGYVHVIIDGRGLSFCEECTYFLKRMYG
jgi:predicted Zn-dependent protease